jgi:hypothetical protein
VKERRKGPIGRATGIAEGVAAAVRRAQRDRAPRVLLYDDAGISRTLQPDTAGYDLVLDACEGLVELASDSAEAEEPAR